jgi:hypothetical protein
MDKVKLYPQERLDLGDAGALQQLVYDYVQDALGSLLGPARGCLSQPSVTFINGTPDKISLSDFSFIASKPIGESIYNNRVKRNNFSSHIVKFDSLLTDHGNYPIPLTGVDNTMFLWARPLMVATDLSNRRKWDVAQGGEVTFSDNTRERMRVEFAFSATDPTVNGDDFEYSPLAKVASITGSLILLTFISAFDSEDMQAVTGESGTFYDSANTNATAFSGMLPTYRLSDYDVNVGLLSVIHALGRMTRQMHAKGENDPAGTVNPAKWYDTQPKISLNGAYKALQIKDTEIQDLYNTIDNVATNIQNAINPRLPNANLVPFAYWVISGNPRFSYPHWRIIRGTSTTLHYLTNRNDIIITMSPDLINYPYFVNGCSVQQVCDPVPSGVNNGVTLNRVSTQFYWKPNGTSTNEWMEGSTGDRVFKFRVLPWILPDETSFTFEEYNNLAASDITLLITLFGAPINP